MEMVLIQDGSSQNHIQITVSVGEKIELVDVVDDLVLFNIKDIVS